MKTNTPRKIIISLVGILVIAGGYFGMQKLGSREKPQRTKPPLEKPTVFTQTVKNGSVPITVLANGIIQAQERIELYSEVQGIFEYSSQSFRPGVAYAEGDILIQINSNETRANLRAQKSQLYNQIVAILPELKFDYPSVYEKWSKYTTNFDVNKTLSPLPQITDEKEKLFIAGNNINATWYTVKNVEELLRKYAIYAPYNGVLTVTEVDKGALVRAGQKLGEFINPNNLELSIAVNAGYIDFLKVGSSVTLYTVDKSKTYRGTISRINSLIDPATQTAQAYISVSGKGLKEGMYLDADLRAKDIKSAYEISRKLLVQNNYVYKVIDSTIVLTEIEPVYFKESTVVIKGLNDGDQILSKSLPGAYDGMKVKKAKQ